MLVFAGGVILRSIPELVAHPYPIGYDVINYYIPVIANFDEHWSHVSKQFPLYVVILSFIHTVTELSPHIAVTALAIAMFGIFSSSVFFVARSLLKLNVGYSVFLAIFVIFQMAVLRTTWDLHRDVFALCAMLLAFCLLGGSGRNSCPSSSSSAVSRKAILAALIIISTILAVAADRMIGMLFCISMAVYALKVRTGIAILSAVIAASLFAILIATSNIDFGLVASSQDSAVVVYSKSDSNPYNAANLSMLFIITNGLLVPTAVVGFLWRRKKKIDGDDNAVLLLKVPLLTSLIGASSWLIFPNTVTLLADRWIILSGIFLSIFAGDGIVRIILSLRAKLAMPTVITVLTFSVLGVFIAIGLAYATMPYSSPFVLYSITRANTESFAPVTMQFNSVDVDNSEDLLNAISWINDNTEPNAVILGEEHWKGWMEIELRDNRIYKPFADPDRLLDVMERHEAVYLMKYSDGGQDSKTKSNNIVNSEPVYSNTVFTVLEVKTQKQHLVFNNKE